MYTIYPYVLLSIYTTKICECIVTESSLRTSSPWMLMLLLVHGS